MRDALKLVFVVLALAVMATPALAAKVTLTGSVTYREKLALPEGAVLRVRLVDASAANSPARVKAEAPIASPGEVPLTFNLNFDDKLITAGHSYVLIAEISAGSKLYFQNFEGYAVDPLAPAAPIVITTNFVGQTAPAPAAPSTPAAAPEPAVLDVVWHAVEIGGVSVPSKPVVSLSITPDMRAGGRGGCNSYFAQAELDGAVLSFSAVAATRIACSDAINAQETSFFDALGRTRSWRLDSGDLVLADATGTQVARLAH